MAIQISPNGRLMTIQTNDSSYQMLADKNGVLLHLYYGSSIGAEDLSDLIVRSDVGFSGNPEEAGLDRTYSLDTLPQEVASSGVGDFRDDSVRLAHPDGSCAADFRFESCEVVSGAYSIPGMPALYDTDKKNSETLIIKMKEKASGAILHLYYGVWEEENVITRTASLTNAGKEPIYIEKFLSCSMDMMDRDLDLISFTGRHAMERTMERTPVTHIKTEFGSIRGTSSHHYNPAMILCDRHATEDAGDCFGLCLAYSGSFTAMVQKAQKANLTTINSLIDELFGDIKTSFSNTELISLAAKVFNYSLGETIGFPFEKNTTTLGNKGSVVVPCDLESNVKQLHVFLYDDNEYAPTDTVKNNSAQIVNDTGFHQGEGY